MFTLRLRHLLVLALFGAVSAFAKFEAPDLLRGRIPVVSEGLRNVDGNVVLVATVDREGNVIDVVVQSSTDSDLEQPCIEAMRTWKYTPAHRDGQAVEAKVKQRFRFGEGQQ